MCCVIGTSIDFEKKHTIACAFDVPGYFSWRHMPTKQAICSGLGLADEVNTVTLSTLWYVMFRILYEWHARILAAISRATCIRDTSEKYTFFN